MKKLILLASIVLLLITTQLNAQPINLNWGASYSPSWANGALTRSATNIGGFGVNCTTTVSMNGLGSFTLALGSSGALTPTVSGATFTVPGATNRLQVTPDFVQNSSYVNIVFSFTSLISNVSFRIVDIDKSSSTSTTYFDRVTITGSDGVSSFNPSITKYDATTDPNFLIISGNVAQVNTTSGQSGNTDSDASDQRGTVNVNFGSAIINSITIRYDNAPGANNNTAAQSIAIGDMSFASYTLPVNWGSFTGKRQQKDVLLNWYTLQEINSASFEIERSSGSSWENIGNVIAAGNSYSRQDYQFIDQNAPDGTLFYRLKQLDTDNNFKYSGIIKISSITNKQDITTFPNPFADHLTISIQSTGQTPVSIALSDATGKIILKETKYLYQGVNSIGLQVPVSLPKGIYQVTIMDASGNITGRSKILRE